MYPVYLDSNKGLTSEEFVGYFLQICKDHKNNDRALAFAFLVYDFHDHTIREMLQNSNYWDSLHIISGKLLTIFYVDSQEGRFKKEQEINSRLPEGAIGHWYSMQLKDTPLENTVKFLKETFGINEYIKHPFVIFFQTDGEIIIDNFVVALKTDKLEEAFLELKSHIKEAVDSVSQVESNSTENHQEIFNLIKGRVERGIYVSYIKTKAKSVLTVSVNKRELLVLSAFWGAREIGCKMLE